MMVFSVKAASRSAAVKGRSGLPRTKKRMQFSSSVGTMKKLPLASPGLAIMLHTGKTWLVMRRCRCPASVGRMPMSRKP